MPRKLTDSNMYTIDEFALWSEQELIEAFDLSRAEVRWLLREVKCALTIA
jgi:hypothetical protein